MQNSHILWFSHLSLYPYSWAYCEKKEKDKCRIHYINVQNSPTIISFSQDNPEKIEIDTDGKIDTYKYENIEKDMEIEIEDVKNYLEKKKYIFIPDTYRHGTYLANKNVLLYTREFWKYKAIDINEKPLLYFVSPRQIQRYAYYLQFLPSSEEKK